MSYIEVTGLGAPVLSSFAAQGYGAHSIGSLLASDPIFSLFALHYRSISGSIGPDVIMDFNGTLLDDRPIFNLFHSLRVLSSALSTKLKRLVRRKYPTWNARDTVRLSGVVGNVSSTEALLSTLLPGWQLPIQIGALYATGSQHSSNTSIRHLSFDDIRDVVANIRPFIGNAMQRRPSSYYNSTNQGIVSLVVGLNSIKYVVKAPACSITGNGTWTAPFISVYFSRTFDSDGREILGVTVTDIRNAVRHNGNSLTGVLQRVVETTWVIPTGTTHRTAAQQMALNERARIIGYNVLRHPFQWANGSLWLTQSKALQKVMIDASKNFETLMEATDTAEFFKGLMQPSFRDLAKDLFGSKLDWNAKRNKLYTLIVSVPLAGSFVVKPTAEAFLGMFTAAIDDGQTYGEDSKLTQITRASEVTTLPAVLQDLLTDLTSELKYDGVHFPTSVKVRTSSYAYHTVSPKHFIEELLSLDTLARVGVIPMPSGIWNTVLLSFAIDWWLHIGELMKAFEFSTLAAVNSDIYRLNHSVDIGVRYSNGMRINGYFRSKPENVHFILPAAEPWFPEVQLPAIALPLFLALGFAFLLPKGTILEKPKRDWSDFFRHHEGALGV